MTLFALIV